MQRFDCGGLLGAWPASVPPVIPAIAPRLVEFPGMNLRTPHVERCERAQKKRRAAVYSAIRRWRKNNPDKARAQTLAAVRRWRANNPGKVAASVVARRNKRRLTKKGK